MSQHKNSTQKNGDCIKINALTTNVKDMSINIPQSESIYQINGHDMSKIEFYKAFKNPVTRNTKPPQSNTVNRAHQN
jgi:hypothetical protein